jgi:outer membrane protein assembly factor BamB
MQIKITARRALSTAASAAFLCAFVTAAAAKGSSEDATAFQINPAHTGSVDFAAGFSAPLVKAWTYDTGGTVSFPLIAHGAVYVVSASNDVFAIDLAAGTKKWEHLLGGDDNLGAYDDGMLFYDNSDGQLIALKASNGKQKWSASVASDFDSSAPVAEAGTVYVGGPGVTALDEKTGLVQWSQGVEATSSQVAIGDDGVFAGGPCQYYKFASKDGSPLWQDAGGCEGGGGIEVAYFNKRAYVVDWAEGNFVLNSKTGAVAGSFSGNFPPSFFSSGKHGFELVISNGKLYCLDAKTGNVAWTFANSNLTGQPVVINGQPVVNAGNSVYMLDGTTGAQLWTDNVGGPISSLAAGDGVLAVTTGNKVIAYVPQ